MAEDRNLDTVFRILGSSTRRRVLGLLSEEPMYFNQIAREVGVGQQSVLRHLSALRSAGFVKSFAEKSGRGAPDRKYFRIDSSFTMSFSISEDDFSINHTATDFAANKEAGRILDDVAGMSDDTGAAIEYLHNSLQRIDEEIAELERRINGLREVRQAYLRQTHIVGRNRFDPVQRRTLYSVLADNLASVGLISDRIGESDGRVRGALREISSVLPNGRAKRAVGLIARAGKGAGRGARCAPVSRS